MVYRLDIGRKCSIMIEKWYSDWAFTVENRVPTAKGFRNWILSGCGDRRHRLDMDYCLNMGYKCCRDEYSLAWAGEMRYRLDIECGDGY